MNSLYSATVDHYKAKRSKALATLELCLNNAVGIGKHLDLLEKIRKWTEVFNSANSVLETLDRYLVTSGDQIQIENFDHQMARAL